jgi:hypothetical protein
MISVSFDSWAPELLSFFLGMISLAGALIGYAKQKGVKLLPASLEGSVSLDEAIKQIQKQLNESERAEITFKKQITAAVQNISISELAEIIQIALKYGQDGYTQGEAEDLGIRIIRAARSKED